MNDEISEINPVPPIYPVPIPEGCPPGQGYSWQFVLIFLISVIGRIAGQYIMRDKK
jgi:hypothetical protein